MSNFKVAVTVVWKISTAVASLATIVLQAVSVIETAQTEVIQISNNR